MTKIRLIGILVLVALGLGLPRPASAQDLAKEAGAFVQVAW